MNVSIFIQLSHESVIRMNTTPYTTVSTLPYPIYHVFKTYTNTSIITKYLTIYAAGACATAKATRESSQIRLKEAANFVPQA